MRVSRGVEGIRFFRGNLQKETSPRQRARVKKKSRPPRAGFSRLHSTAAHISTKSGIDAMVEKTGVPMRNRAKETAELCRGKV